MQIVGIEDENKSEPEKETLNDVANDITNAVQNDTITETIEEDLLKKLKAMITIRALEQPACRSVQEFLKKSHATLNLAKKIFLKNWKS